MRASRRTSAFIALTLAASGLVVAVAPASANHGAEAGATIASGWPRLTDDPKQGGRMNVPNQGSTGFSGWFKHSSPILANIDGDPQTEILSGSLDGKVYVWNHDGTRVPGWPRRLDAPSTPTGPINGTVAVADVDADGKPEIAAGSDNGWVFVFKADGTLMPGWPRFTGNNADFPHKCATDACTGVWATPTLADLDGDGRLEVIVGSFSHLMWVWRHDGTTFPGWPRDVWDGIASSATVGDLDGDGLPEIVVGSDVANDCSDCPPFGRLDKGGLVHAFRQDGSQLPGWPVRTNAFQWSTPSLADLNGDGRAEVISGSGFFPIEGNIRGRHISVWDFSGRLVWRHATDGITIGSPAVADITGDGVAEIAATDTTGRLYLLDANGFRAWVRDGVTPSASNGSGAHFGGAVMGDVTGDGKPEIIATDANFRAKAWTSSGQLVMDVGTCYSMYNSPAIGDIDNDGKNEVVIESAFGNGINSTGPDAPGPSCPTPSNDPDQHQRGGQGEVWVYDTNGAGGLAYPYFKARDVATANDNFFPFGLGFRGGVRVAVGNFTSDAGDELVTAAGPTGGPHIKLWRMDQSKRPVLHAEWFAYGAGFTGGVFVAAADVDGDGTDEIVTSPGAGGGPHVRVWKPSGGSATLFREFFAYDPGFAGGVTVAGGNFASGGQEEIATGPGAGGGPHVRVWDATGTSPSVVREWFAYGAGFFGGIFLAGGDVVSGGPGDELITGPGAGGGPHVRVWQVAGSTILASEFFAYDPGFAGGVRVGAAELTGAAPHELITTPGPGGGPHVRVWDAGARTVVREWAAFAPNLSNGVFPSGGNLSGRTVVLAIGPGHFSAVRLDRRMG